MHKDIPSYNESQLPADKEICELLFNEINKNMPEAEKKIWHAHPVWFLNGNPIVGYSKLKSGVRLMFWSGADFEEKDLVPGSGKFKDASITYNSVNEVNTSDIERWIEKSKVILWDYKNIVKRKGVLEKIR